MASSAEQVATMLAYEFLKEGKFSAAAGPEEVPALVQATAAAGYDSDVAEQRAAGFAGIAVQAVGFEEGPTNANVHIYLTHGSVRLMKSLPQEIDGVPVRAHRMGAITIRPEQASTATNQGYFFERRNRVCCGSSVAPTSEDCSGTLGAL